MIGLVVMGGVPMSLEAARMPGWPLPWHWNASNS